MTTSYQIIDEPSGRFTDIALPPILLLLAALFVPAPYRYLIPLIFLLNAWFLNCHNIKRQGITVAVGCAAIWIGVWIVNFVVHNQFGVEGIEFLKPYLRIVFNAAFLFLLYRLVQMQQPSYDVLTYIKENRQAGRP